MSADGQYASGCLLVDKHSRVRLAVSGVFAVCRE